MKSNVANPSHAFCGSPSVSARLVAMVWLVAFVACNGCGSPSDKRVDLVGRVTYAGRPVPTGRIDFIPALDEAAGGPGGFATIKEGKFNTKVNGRGLAPGSYLARISGFEEQSLQIDEVNHGAPLFATYETKITIGSGQEEVHFEVPAKSNR